MAYIQENIKKFVLILSATRFRPTDAIEILILAIVIYYFMGWIKRTRTWTLLKGLVFLSVFGVIASVLHMTIILHLSQYALQFGMTALIIVFQPELRKALESLGQKKFFSNIILFDMNKEIKERFSDKTITEIVRAVYEMAKVKTGALIVIEQNILLSEYERTGIELDSLVSAQLLINIFEHNTPLHDGAVIISGNRIVAATCYLPLSDNLNLSKDLGTRHRAAVGISEVTDSLTIIISEETGSVSFASEGVLSRDVAQDTLRKKLVLVQRREKEEKKYILWKGRPKDGKKVVK